MFFKPLLRNGMIASVMAIPLLASTTYNALANPFNFRVYNQTAYSLKALYVSATSHDNWDNNIISSSLPSGSSTQVVFADSSACYYDIRAVFSDGEVLNDYDVNVCANSSYHFYPEQ